MLIVDKIEQMIWCILGSWSSVFLFLCLSFYIFFSFNFWDYSLITIHPFLFSLQTIAYTLPHSFSNSRTIFLTNFIHKHVHIHTYATEYNQFSLYDATFMLFFILYEVGSFAHFFCQNNINIGFCPKNNIKNCVAVKQKVTFYPELWPMDTTQSHSSNNGQI